MIAAISALIICASLHSVKAEMAKEYPSYEQQIAQVGLPTIGYREHLFFNWKAFRFQAGKCDLFSKPQVIVVRGKNSAVTLFRLKHELRHFVAFAAGLPDKAHTRIDL